MLVKRENNHIQTACSMSNEYVVSWFRICGFKQTQRVLLSSGMYRAFDSDGLLIASSPADVVHNHNVVISIHDSLKRANAESNGDIPVANI